MDSLPFWPKDRQWLIVIFETADRRDDQASVFVHGLDPDRHEIVFFAELRNDQRQALVTAVSLGEPLSEFAEVLPSPTTRSPRNQNVVTASSKPDAKKADPNTVVITDNGGDGPGPKLTTPPRTYQATLLPAARNAALVSGQRR